MATSSLYLGFDNRYLEQTHMNNQEQQTVLSVWNAISLYDRLKSETRIQIWENLVKWMYFQFKSDHHVVFGHIGIYGFKLERETQQIIPILFYHPSFLRERKLVCKSHSLVVKPLLKINMALIASYCTGQAVSKENVQELIEFMMGWIDMKIKDSSLELLQIDLDVLGTIVKHGDQITFRQYLSKIWPARQVKAMGKSSLRFLVEKETVKTPASSNKLHFLTNRDGKEGFLPKIERGTRDDVRVPSFRKKSYRSIDKKKLRRHSRDKSEQEGQEQQVSSRSMRSVSVKSLSKDSEMMAAGNDPLKKEHNYARLTQDPKSLMQTVFVFQKAETNPNIPILDMFSRTLACPLATQRKNPMVAARIGSNISLATQSLQITPEGIRNLVNKTDNLEDRAPTKSGEPSISEELEYRLVLKGTRSPSEQKLLNFRKHSYKSYRHLFDQIDNKHISQLQHETLQRVINQIDQKYRRRNLTDKMLEEILSYYYQAIKKSIIDYILLDTIQCDRLGVYHWDRQLPLYGGSGNTHSRVSHACPLFKENIAKLNGQLVKNSSCFVTIQKLWCERYSHCSLVVLPSKLDKYMHIDDFVSKQRSSMKAVKDSIINDWMPVLAAIYREQVSAMKRNHPQCLIFFESAATLLSIQIRSLIEAAMLKYKQFLSQYDLEVLNPPDTVVYLQKTHNKYENCFLDVRISYRKDEIYFMHGMSEIKDGILSVLEELRTFSEMIPRPENLITKTDKLFISSIKEDDCFYLNIKGYIDKVIERNVQNVGECLQLFNKYKFIFVENRVIEAWLQETKHDRREYSITFAKYAKIYDEVMQNIPAFVRMNLINLDSSELKNYLLKSTTQIISKMQKSVYELVMSKNANIQRELEDMMKTATSKVTDCDKLVHIESQVDAYRRNGIRNLQSQNADLVKWISITLYNTFHALTKDDLDLIHSTAQFLHRIEDKLESQDPLIFQQRRKLQQQASQDSQQYEQRIGQLMEQLEKLKGFGNRMLKDSALELLQNARDSTIFCIQLVEDLNHRELLLAMDQTEPTKILQIDQALKPLEQLWQLVKQHSILNNCWTRDSIFKLDAKIIDNQTKSMLNKLNKLSTNTIMKTNTPLSVKVAQQLAEELQNFRHKIPLIAAFSNPGLKQRHFISITDLINYQDEVISRKSNIYLNKLLSMGVTKHIEQLESISQVASKQYSIETTIHSINSQWEFAVLEMTPYKNTNINVLDEGNLQEIQALLDSHCLKVITMKGSAHAHTFQQQLNALDEWLEFTNQMIEYSMKVQRGWVSLEAVMTSPDILKHLSVQGAKFRIIDESWRQISKFFTEKSNLREITKNRTVIQKLKDVYRLLQIVKKGLNSYLESKRLAFPRFFFLSDMELLSIISETKNPLRVQPHLSKCFEGIHKLEFQDSKIIIGMYSEMEEYVPFVSKINTGLARGNVDRWLSEVQDKMVNGVKAQIAACHGNYEAMGRKESLMATCAMSVLATEMTRWTNLVEKCIQNNNLDQAYQITKSNLDQTVQLIRGDERLQKVNIGTLQALIVLSVHSLEVVVKLQHKNTECLSDFEWESQLRYYYREFQDIKGSENRTVVRILNSVCEFSHEYLGNTSRLVVTPLTDRCIRTLCSAIYLNYGGALEGPAGTGKTQTVKDLAKALACQCIVFNCSDGLDSKAMSKFFKGLAGSGAWSCFDEFNRIDTQVMSVVAQHILCIQTAKSKGSAELFFQDSEIQLRKNANCFITMNASYASRSNLPDNLKALLRPLAMMMPDSAVIAYVSLYSYGFTDAPSLAQKIITFYKLCSEQLPPRQHYDFGMRAVGSVLMAAGKLKKEYSESNETSLILKAINEVNLGKFVNNDIVLFRNIVSDLFEGIKPIQINYEPLLSKINEVCHECNLTKSDYMLHKVIQIYEMVLVRHGVMIVGPPFAAKTTALQILASALRRCPVQFGESQVEQCTINPKSIPIAQLYGHFDDTSHEWFDGILAVKFRNFANSQHPTRKWLIMDGPIDTIWVQSMNTVLDDNRKLCLSSGEAIPMSKGMSLIFEPMDLLAASPATVSRCGMIYLQPTELGHTVLIQSWLKLNSWLSLDSVLMLKDLFKILSKLYRIIKEELCTIFYTDIFCLTQSLLSILTVEIKPFEMAMREPENSQVFSNSINLFKTLCSVFGFSCIWSFGACVDTESRRLFDHGLKNTILAQIIINNKKKRTGFPEKGILYDYKIHFTDRECSVEWIKWAELLESFKDEPSLQLHSLRVRTAHTLCYGHLISRCCSNRMPILLCGPMGAGKTTLVNNYKEAMNCMETAFLDIVLGSYTTCTEIRSRIESSVEKKGAKNILGPKKPAMIIFVDDLNMPVKEQFGAQPPIEMLRELLDQKGFYDVHEKEKIFKKIIDVQFIFCMPNLNNQVTPRFLRHLSMISVSNLDEDSRNKIFFTILNRSFLGHSELKNISILLKNSIEVYNECIKVLRPTPSKSHYLFNLRDLSKLILGICNADKIKVHSENLGRLWAHECRRVFVDRLLPEDKQVVEVLIDKIGKRWGKNMSQVYFSDILSPSNELSYEQIDDLGKINMAVTSSLNQYNLGDKPMSLILFNYALEHILIILRAIRQPLGNALLVGMGGSGRRSLARLASDIAGHSTASPEVTKNYGFPQFKEDLKKLCKQIGIKNKPIDLLFSDTMIKDQRFLESINDILNLGYIPNLYRKEERLEICEAVRKDAFQESGKEISLDQLFEYFEKRIKLGLRLILCFSPTAQLFRTRIRMFPSLINCTTIDWFNEWPESGLVSVSKHFLAKVELPHRQKYTNLFSLLHCSAKQWGNVFDVQLNRKFYVTPTSYIEFLTTFKQLLSSKQKQIKELIYKYQNGFARIVETENSIEQIKRSLREIKPQIQQAAQDTILKLELAQIQKEEADEIMLQVTREEKTVFEAVKHANQIKEDCEKQLAAALPQLQEAENALLVLEKNSMTELRSMKNPPLAVRLTLQGLCLLLDPTPKQKIKNEETFKMETDWWAASLRLLSNPKLLNELVEFNKNELSENVVNNLDKFLNDPKNSEILSVVNVAKCSPACECFIRWVNGISNFYSVNKRVKPKKQSLMEAEAKVAALEQKLGYKRQQLNCSTQKVDEINYELEWTRKNKEKLQKQYSECEVALQRAAVIMQNLGSQKSIWLGLSEKYKGQLEQVGVKVLVAAAQITYFGPFTHAFRSRILNEWVGRLKQNGLDICENFSLTVTLGDPLAIQSWNLNGLPIDNFSIENALMIYNSRRWPLLIDPQGQANQWLKKQEIRNKLKVAQPTEDNFNRTLQNCIQFGTPILIENLGQEISAELIPVLLKQTSKKGTTTYLKMGDNMLIYSQDFRLYMTTKLSNPHYLPQICTQVVLINFMLTEQGLTDQLLSLILSRERPELVNSKHQLTLQSAQNQRSLQQIESQVLGVLGNSSNILADENAIDVLSTCKYKSDAINQKQQATQSTKQQITEICSQYKQLAREGSDLFFVVASLEQLNHVYSFSLEYFMDLYDSALAQAKGHDERCSSVRQFFRSQLFIKIGRGLFQKHRLTFGALIALKLAKLPQEVVSYLCTSNSVSASKKELSEVKAEWMTERLWRDMLRLSELGPFHSLLLLLRQQKNMECLKKIVESDNPFSEKIPLIYQNQDQAIKLAFYKCLRPDKFVESLTEYVSKTIELKFAPFDLQGILSESTPKTPIFVILSAGSEPFVSITKLAKSGEFTYNSVSLGQGQGAYAEKLIARGIERGGWVILQNCHLAPSWMPKLQRIVEQLFNSEDQVHQDFRLWLTAQPSQSISQLVLQKSLKVASSPVKGLKNNLMASFSSDPINDSDYFNSRACEPAFKKLLYALTFFHAVIQERIAYGHLGWNISYQFSQSDLRISCMQLKIYTDNAGNSEKNLFEALSYIIVECNYGGKVIDQNDHRLLKTLFQQIFNSGCIANPNNHDGNTQSFVLPSLSNYEEYIDYIDSLPSFTSPEILGLHPNVNITKNLTESHRVLDDLRMCLSPKGQFQAQSKQQHVLNLIQTILSERTLSSIFPTQQVLKKFPIIYQESMNTVLNQEISRYNTLISLIKTNLDLLTKAIQGFEVMTPELQKIYQTLGEGKVPDAWLCKSYLTLKPLASFISDLGQRVRFFEKWIKKGTPSQFWLSGFFFPHSFLSGILQNHSRKQGIPIDKLAFDFRVREPEGQERSQFTSVYGLFLEGAGWNHQKCQLKESDPGGLLIEFPTLYLAPVQTQQLPSKHYESPLYRTAARSGTLSTTGHSDNLVMLVKIPTSDPPDHWIKRGVALLAQTSF